MKQIIILFALCLLPSIATAQTYTMKGVVYDETGETLPGVSVFIKGTTIGTSTDANGTFSIKAAKGNTIAFSYIGYEDYEYRVEKEDANMQIHLAVSAVNIDEVVVTGLAKQRKISVVGAITAVDVSELQTPATSMVNMLGGRVPGVISMMNSGEPGKNISEFWVRGIGTFGASSAALVLIDGLEGDLNSIDPADVESFSVLKDASATAVYGVRGANGVILVTTKRGSVDRLKITARVNLTLSYLTRMPEYLRAYDYAGLANEAKVVRGDEPLYTPLEMRFIQYHLDRDLYPDVDWQNEILKRNGFQQTYYMSAAGGGEIAQYFISLGMSNEAAAYKMDPSSVYKTGVGYDTYNYRMNLDINMTKTTSLYFGVNGYLTQQNQPGLANTDYLWEGTSMLTPLTVPIKYSTGQLPSYGAAAEGLMSPYVSLNYTGRASNQTNTGNVTMAVSQDFKFILEGLKLRIQGAYDTKNYFTERRYVLPDLFVATGRNIKGELLLARRLNAVSAQYVYNMRQYRKYHLESTLTWDKNINNEHRVSALAYYYMSDQKDTYDIDNSGINRSAAAIPKRYQGISSRFTYGFKDTYMIDLNFGYTGSENFEPGKQFGFFPSAAIGWIPTQYDPVREKLPWLSFLKLRASYGSVGSDRIASFRFPYLTTVIEGAATGWGVSDIGLSEDHFGASNLMWEKAMKADFGIEGKLFNQQLSFVVDFFNDSRDGIFQERQSIPLYVGLTSGATPYGNVGRMRSYGTDGNIDYFQSFNDDMHFTLRANYTYSQNEVLNWEQAPAKYPYQLYNGYPTDRIQGYIATGLFRDEQDIKSSPVQTFGGVKVMPGDIKYKDVNGDGLINTDDRVFLSDPTYPRLMYGFGGEFGYKNFTLGLLFKGTGKTNYYSVGYYSASYGTNGPGYVPFWSGETGNVLSLLKDPSSHWIPKDYAIANGIDPSLAENPNARFPRLTYGYNANNSQLSTWWKGDSRYLRLQEVTLNYHWAHQSFRKLGVTSIDLQFVGSNLYVWDKVKDWDPEQAYRNGRAYPIPARYTLQMKLNF
ncbi:MAG: TonB-dependent receptor [Tannerella sp.]|jgi:TonB-linked SusC/RagA family outer membrane protein|nr:TonB-dependent receptor [Tannerella sp.]